MNKLCKDCACENVCGITHLPEDKACGFYYRADAITELEKLKAEIKDNYTTDVAEDIIWLIDEHIKELKGENKCQEKI